MPFIEFSNPILITTSPTLPVVPVKYRMKSLFSNNAQVCYKLHNQSGGGVGTVKNARHIGQKT